MSCCWALFFGHSPLNLGVFVVKSFGHGGIIVVQGLYSHPLSFGEERRPALKSLKEDTLSSHHDRTQLFRGSLRNVAATSELSP